MEQQKMSTRKNIIMSKIKRTKHYIEFLSEDSNGKFKVSIQTDCSQMRMSADIGESFIDTDIIELTAIRDLLTEVIDTNK